MGRRPVQTHDPAGRRLQGGRISTPTVLAVLALPLVYGCAVPRLDSARGAFYAGRASQAIAHLADVPADPTDRVLFLMERGLMAQGLGEYERSTIDLLRAAQEAERLDYYSLTRGTASFLINDRTLAYRGKPYERTLLHAFAAKNFLARGLWDDAAVEARCIIDRLEHLDGFPDDPYSRYLAACCLAWSGDSEGAAFQFRKVTEQIREPTVDPVTGRFGPMTGEAELVCFVLIGRGPGGNVSPAANARWGPSPYAEIYAGTERLGRSYSFISTWDLAAATQRRLAMRQALKTGTRIVVKDTLAHVVERRNEELGALVWLMLFALEQPDTRAWESLPAWLQVARVSCPRDLSEYRIVFRSASGTALREKTVNRPFVRRGNTFVSFCRDFP